MAVALLVVLVAGLAYAQDMPDMGDGMGDMPPPPVGCGWPKEASACPMWDGLKYVHPETHMPYDISQQDVPCEPCPFVFLLAELGFGSRFR